MPAVSVKQLRARKREGLICVPQIQLRRRSMQSLQQTVVSALHIRITLDESHVQAHARPKMQDVAELLQGGNRDDIRLGQAV